MWLVVQGRRVPACRFLEDSKRCHTSDGGNAEPGSNLGSTCGHDSSLRRARCGVGSCSLSDTRDNSCGSRGVGRDAGESGARGLQGSCGSHARSHVWTHRESELANEVVKVWPMHGQGGKESSRRNSQEVTGTTPTSVADVVKPTKGTVTETITVELVASIVVTGALAGRVAFEYES